MMIPTSLFSWVVLVSVFAGVESTKGFHGLSRIAFASPSEDTRSSTSIPSPPPISMPVWSLACPSGGRGESRTEEEPMTSMNIVTFATPVSVAQPKLWAVSLYHSTLTKDSFFANSRGVLQLLKPKHKTLVPVLGKRSGYEPRFSKQTECSKLGFPWGCHENIHDSTLELLPDCALYIELELVSSVEAGDHILALAQVVGTGAWDSSAGGLALLEETPSLSLDPSTALYTAQLRAEGII